VLFRDGKWRWVCVTDNVVPKNVERVEKVGAERPLWTCETVEPLPDDLLETNELYEKIVEGGETYKTVEAVEARQNEHFFGFIPGKLF
jgi:hypothetical protein